MSQSAKTEPVNDIFEFIKKSNSLRIDSQFRPDDPNDKIWYRT